MPYRNRMTNNSGVVFLAALMVMAILMTFALAHMFIARTELKISNNAMDTVKLYYLTEAGVEYSMAELQCGYTSCSTDNTLRDGAGWLDLDGDGGDDFDARYDDFVTGPKNILARGWMGATYKSIKAKVNDSGFPSAVMAGGNGISFKHPTLPLVGTINGNFENANDILLNGRLSKVTLVGRAECCGPVIPDPDFDQYKAAATTYYNTAEVWIGDVGSSADEIHYIDGNLDISGDAGTDINILGTVVVKGDLTIGFPTGLNGHRLTITPSPGKPAVVAEGVISGGIGADMEFNGMVYAGDRITSSSFNTMTINGPLIVKGGPMASGVRDGTLDITYDPDLDPGTGFFTGGNVGKPVLVSWQGYES